MRDRLRFELYALRVTVRYAVARWRLRRTIAMSTHDVGRTFWRVVEPVAVAATMETPLGIWRRLHGKAL